MLHVTLWTNLEDAMAENVFLFERVSDGLKYSHKSNGPGMW